MEQESWNMGKEETGRLPPEGPKLCANNCGFFGSAITMNLCSQCYRDTVMKQAKATTSATTSCQPQNLHSEIGETASQPKEVGSESLEISSSSQKIPNRCFACKKRVGLTGFKCRCGNQFCSLHRYHDKHDCTFDYRTAAQEAIAKANPVIKADRIEKI